MEPKTDEKTVTFTKVIPTYCCFPGKEGEESNRSKNIVICYVSKENMSGPDTVQILESNQKLDPENDPDSHSGKYSEVFIHNNQPVYQRT